MVFTASTVFTETAGKKTGTPEAQAEQSPEACHDGVKAGARDERGVKGAARVERGVLAVMLVAPLLAFAFSMEGNCTKEVRESAEEFDVKLWI